MKVTFILPAYNEEYAPMVSLGSLLCQTNPDWDAAVVHNGTNLDMKQMVDERIAPDDFRIQYKEVIPATNTPTTSRMAAIKYGWAIGEWVVSASIQDYFLPTLVEDILAVADNADFIMWNGYNHHYMSNQIHCTGPRVNHTDWCNFAIRTKLAREVGIVYDPVEDHHYDGIFAEKVMQVPGVRFVKIEKFLVVHT